MGSGQPQASQGSSPEVPVKRGREAEIEQIIAEEKSTRSKMPKYPGLERYVLLEKMGDGAFSNVYRAKDTTGEFDEVAIKVVRKFEMNSTQVGESSNPYLKFLVLRLLASILPCSSRLGYCPGHPLSRTSSPMSLII